MYKLERNLLYMINLTVTNDKNKGMLYSWWCVLKKINLKENETE